MNSRHFDSLTRSLAASADRRQALKTLIVAAVSLFAPGGRRVASAQLCPVGQQSCGGRCYVPCPRGLVFNANCTQCVLPTPPTGCVGEGERCGIRFPSCCTGIAIELNCQPDIHPVGRVYERCCPPNTVPCSGQCIGCADPAQLDPETCQCARNVPQVTAEFRSSSGGTFVQYYEYDSGLCTGAGGDCRFSRGLIHVPTGFTLVEVFLASFQLEAAGRADAVEAVQVQVQKHRYDPATGDLELSVSAILGTASGQEYTYRVAFVVVLTHPDLGNFTSISASCGGPAGECIISAAAPNAIPPNPPPLVPVWNYIGLASQRWDLRSLSGPLPLTVLSAEPNLLGPLPTPALPDVQVEYRCAMHDVAKGNDVACEWEAMVVAFRSDEMEEHAGSPGSSPYGGSAPPEYWFTDGLAPDRRIWTAFSPNLSPPLSGTSLTGFLDAFAGLSLAFDVNQEFPVWTIVDSAGNFQLIDPNTVATDYEVFLGTNFGDPVVTEPFAFRAQRAFGFLH
jgi:hypothetical protein